MSAPDERSTEPVEGERARQEPVGLAPCIYVEPWPAGGWVIRLEDHPVPVSRHDTEEEAEFRAAAYRRGLERGQQLALSREGAPPADPGGGPATA